MPSCYKKQTQQVGGAACKLCGSLGTNQTTCPLNPSAKNPNQAKHHLADPKRGPTKRMLQRQALAPAAPSVPSTRVGKMVKNTTTKSYGSTDRLSAGEYYRKYGPSAVGQVCDIRGNGELKCLLLKKNGVPYWAKASASGKGQEPCGNWRKNCRESL